MIISSCPVCSARSIGVVEKIAAGFTSEVRCNRCGACVRLQWPPHLRRTWIQTLALGSGLIFSFVLLTPVPLAIGLMAMVLAPVFLGVVANTRDPLTARRMRAIEDGES